MEYLDRTLKDLFVDLHCSGLWHDEKAISDSILLHPAEAVLADYAAEKAKGQVDLAAFYQRHFRPVTGQDHGFRTDPDHSPTQHLAAIWPHLTKPADDPAERSTRYALPHPYVVVGGRFQEAYYWDSYFTMLGLLASNQPQHRDLVRHMLDNFAHAIRDIGHIPNGFRSYFLTRSQPPFFAAMVRDYGRATGDLAGAYATYRAEMEAEYRYFMDGSHRLGDLNRYWDADPGPRIEMLGTDLALAKRGVGPDFFRNLRAACESGWDFSSRWLTDPKDLTTIRTTEIWPIDLNCLMVVQEEILAEATTGAASAAYQQAADRRRAALGERCFDTARGYFFDVLAADGQIIPITTAAGMFALYAGVASPEQARRAVDWALAHLMQPGGLLTTDVASGQQWDAPNGWAPLQWIAVQGLRRYGFAAEADDLRRRWMATCETVFRASGKFVEKYNVLDPLAPSGGGEYALQDGFGWTNGVYLDFARG